MMYVLGATSIMTKNDKRRSVEKAGDRGRISRAIGGTPKAFLA